MTVTRVIALFLVLMLTGCGGGGSGAGDGGTGGGSGGGGSNPPAANGTAEIVFPWTSSTATAQTVTVNGTASDPEGVARVLVNGLDATITATGSISPPGIFSKTNLQEGEVAWSAQVTLASGDNPISVSVEDTDGDVTDDVDTATVKYVEVPIYFTLDPDRTRVVGLSFTMTAGGFEQNLVEHNYETLEQTVYDPIQTAPELSCFRRFDDEFIYLSFFAGTWELRRYDLTTRADVLLSELDPSVQDGGPGFETGIVRELVCGGTSGSAYVLVNHAETSGGGFAKSRILEIDLAALDVTTLSETDTAVSPRWIAQHIALAEDQIVSLEDISPLAPLTSVSVLDGARSALAPGLDVGGFVLHPELSSERVYVATFEGIDEINLATLEKQNVSVVDASDPLAFAQIRSIGFDAANDRIVVGDSDLDKLIAVDITTGERTEFLSQNAGVGTTLVAPRAFAISADASRAYVADDGGNVAERLFEIDLATGDRRQIGDIAQPFNVIATGLALDETGRRVFVSFDNRVLEVDLDTEAVSTVADVDSSVLDSISSIMLDPGANRLLIADPTNDGVFALDLDTLTIDVVSQEGVQGIGPAIGTIVSMTGAQAAAEIYAAGQSSGNITRVNLETGDRETLSTNCNVGASGIFQGLEQVLYNEAASELLVLSDRLFSIDLATDACVTLPGSVFSLEIQNVSANQLFAVTFRTLMQIDRETGEIAIISK